MQRDAVNRGLNARTTESAGPLPCSPLTTHVRPQPGRAWFFERAGFNPSRGRPRAAPSPNDLPLSSFAGEGAGGWGQRAGGGGQSIATQHLSQTFLGDDGQRLLALQDVSLRVGVGEFVSIIGPSGCGKSTLLNILAGLDAPSAGEVLLGERVTTPRERLGQVGLMPQRDLLLPWRTALGNAIAGLRVRGVPRNAAREQARDLFARFGLAEFAGAFPYALSGGMRQRVALVRSALAAGPVLLLDEPFGALDALTRADLRRWLLEAWQTLRKTIILVTHDGDEALLLSDYVIALTSRPGQVRGVVEVPLPRPRDLAVQNSPDFGALRQRLLGLLEVTE